MEIQGAGGVCIILNSWNYQILDNSLLPLLLLLY